MTISQIRRRVAALKRRFAPELAIIKLRRIAEAVADDWDSSESPEPADVIGGIAKAGFRLPTFASLGRYLNDTRRQGMSPILAPLSSTSSPGPGKTGTANSFAGTSPPLHSSHALNLSFRT